MHRRALTDHEIQTFRRDGVVHVPAAFPAELVPRAIAAVDDELLARYGDGVRTSTGMTRRLYRHNDEFRHFAFDRVSRHWPRKRRRVTQSGFTSSKCS